jgi:hypothetical protein
VIIVPFLSLVDRRLEVPREHIVRRRGLPKSISLAVVDSQQENGDVTIDVTEAVAHRPDVFDPRGDSSTDPSSGESERDLSPRKTRRVGKGTSFVWFPSFL